MIEFTLSQQALDQLKSKKSEQFELPQISLEESKSRRFNSYFDMIQEIRKAIKMSKIETAINSDFSEEPSRVVKATASNISNAILSICDVAVKRTAKGNIFFIQDPTSKLMRSDELFVKGIITDLSSDQYKKSYIEVNDIAKLTRDTLVKMSYDGTVRNFKDMPKKYIVMKNDLVIDVESQKVISIDEIYDHYDVTITNKSSLLVNEKLDVKRTLNREIINRVMKDWSENDEDVELLLWQIIYAVLLGKNFDKFIVIQGPGGNGKSTFMTLLTKLVGFDQTVFANIHQFSDPNTLNVINKSTRLIVGDDAATNHKISDVALSNLKSLVTGDPLSLPVKYSSNVVVQTDALFIQGTNTDISFYENNPAIKSRALVIEWAKFNYRENKPTDITFDLDELLDTQHFIDEWSTMCLEKVSHFEKFHIPEKVKRATETMVESNDSIKMFLDDVYPQIDGFREIPLSVLYQAFLKWSKLSNPSGGIMKLYRFNKELTSKAGHYKFKVSSEQVRFGRHENKNSICQILDIDSSAFGQYQRYLEPDQPLSDEEFNDIRSTTYDNLNERQFQAAAILMFDKKESDIISIYGNHFQD